MAPPVGLEPTTSALTVQRSTIELQGNNLNINKKPIYQTGALIKKLNFMNIQKATDP